MSEQFTEELESFALEIINNIKAIILPSGLHKIISHLTCVLPVSVEFLEKYNLNEYVTFNAELHTNLIHAFYKGSRLELKFKLKDSDLKKFTQLELLQLAVKYDTHIVPN